MGRGFKNHGKCWVKTEKNNSKSGNKNNWNMVEINSILKKRNQDTQIFNTY